VTVQGDYSSTGIAFARVSMLPGPGPLAIRNAIVPMSGKVFHELDHLRLPLVGRAAFQKS